MNTETLALKYRPRKLSEIVGQKSVRLILGRMVKDNNLPIGFLFSGIRGTGKTSVARIIAAALNCEEVCEEKPCGLCVSCKSIFDTNSLDVFEIDAASNGNVADIRALTDQLRYQQGGRTRVVLLDEAQSMSNAAFNALLKTLEEPPPETVFVLLTTEPNDILDTVVSRLMTFEFRKIFVGDIVERLRYICEKENIEVAPDLLLTIAERSNGGMRDAVMTLDQVTRVGVKTTAEFSELLGESDFGPDIVKAMLSGNQALVFESLETQLARTGDAAFISIQIISTLRDVMVLHAGGNLPKQGKSLQVRKEISAVVSSEKVFAALRVLWDLKTKVGFSEDQRSMLELASVMVTEVLGNKPKLQSVVSEPPKKLSLSDMRKL